MKIHKGIEYSCPSIDKIITLLADSRLSDDVFLQCKVHLELIRKINKQLREKDERKFKTIRVAQKLKREK